MLATHHVMIDGDVGGVTAIDGDSPRWVSAEAACPNGGDHAPGSPKREGNVIVTRCTKCTTILVADVP